MSFLSPSRLRRASFVFVRGDGFLGLAREGGTMAGEMGERKEKTWGRREEWEENPFRFLLVHGMEENEMTGAFSSFFIK